MISFRTILFIFLVLLFGSHYLAYFSMIHFFAITNNVHKKILASAFAFLSISFILSSFLISRQENYFTRMAYLLSGYWLGLLVNLLLAITAVWLVIAVYQLMGFQPKATMLSLICFGLAFMYSVYGIWNAGHPQIKNITVTIPNLPQQWKNKVIVQLSDVHMGHVYRAEFLQRIVAKVNAVHPDMVVITGDFFDGMDGDLEQLVQPLNDLAPEKGIFFITGNHENFLGEDQAFAAFQNTRVQILQDQVVDVDGLKVTGISYPRRGENKDVVGVLHSLEKDFAGRPNLFLFHAPTHIDEFKNSGVNLQLSGHTHRGQIFPFRYITDLVYKGYDYGLHRMGNYTLYTTDGAGTWGPAMRTGNTPEIVVVTLQ